jgi:hypothetical protein
MTYDSQTHNRILQCRCESGDGVVLSNPALFPSSLVGWLDFQSTWNQPFLCEYE